MQMDRQLASYVIRYYSRFMHVHEQLAYRHLSGTAKVTNGHSDEAAQGEAARSAKTRSRGLLSDDPEVLLLARDGLEAFVERTAARIFNEHTSEIFLNDCPRCGALAKTPKARQCRLCFHDWHDDSPATR